MGESICRLCLRTTLDTFPISEDDLKALLDHFLLKSVLNISEQQNMVCSECKHNLQVFYDFKTACVVRDVADCNSDANMKDIENKSAKPVVQDPMSCNFCKKIIGKLSFIYFIELKKNTPIVNLERHNPELNATNSKEVSSCESCHNLLQGLQHFRMNCLDVEEKIRKCTEAEGANDNSRIDLKKVQEFAFKPTLRQEIGTCNANKTEVLDDEKLFVIKSELELKHENEDDLQPIIKHEEIDIKLEEDELDKINRNMEQEKATYRYLFERKMYGCNECAFETSNVRYMIRHIVTHKDPSIMTIFKCEVCLFETKYEGYMKRHLSIHDPSIGKTYVVTHKDSSEITIHKCEICTYETGLWKSYKHHLLSHKDRAERKIYKCKVCPFKTISVSSLRNHRMTHMDPLDIPIYKCDKCSFESKMSSYLKTHMLTHKDYSERKKYKCNDCAYEVITKLSLKRHAMTHKDPSCMEMHRCELCKFQTIYIEHLRRHILTHKDPSERRKYTCKDCAYETLNRSCLQRHSLTHKDPLEITIYKCDSCPYTSKHIDYVRHHMKRMNHKNPSATR